MRTSTRFLTKALCAAAFIVSAGAHAAVVISSFRSVPFEVPPLFTNVVGACTIDFDISLANSSCNVVFVDLVGGSIVAGSVEGQHAAPPGNSNTNNYLTVSPSTLSNAFAPISLVLGNTTDYFGFYVGSLDPYNTIAFYNDNGLITSFDGNEVNNIVFAVDASGNQSQAAYIDFRTDDPSQLFNRIVFNSTQNAFEMDNLAFARVPVPATVALLGLGLVGLGFQLRRRSV